MVILAVMAAAVSIALSGAGGERQLEREAERLEALLGYACEHAEISGRAVGLTLLASGYGFAQQQGDSWNTFAQGELRQREWPGAIRAELSRDGLRIDTGAEPPVQPPVICYASGELTPFRLELGLPDLALRWRLEAQGNGELKRERRDASH